MPLNPFTVYNQLDLVTSQKVALFDSLGTPFLNYGAEIWGHNESPEICRKLLCVKRSTNRDTLYGVIL